MSSLASTMRPVVSRMLLRRCERLSSVAHSACRTNLLRPTVAALHSNAAAAAAAGASATPHTTASATPTKPSGSSPVGGTCMAGTQTVHIDRPLELSLGSTLPALSINYFDSLSFDPLAASKPCIYIMPSMSHSALVCRSPAHRASHSGPAGWWEEVVGFGDHFGINLDRFRVLSASPLGAPYGTTSPLSIDPRNGRQYRAQFPLITPLDQARVHAYLLDHLGIRRVHAIVGASMGGMQVLQFAVHFPQRYDRIIAIATTAQTSPSTQALRGVQRAAVRTDPFFADGNYADAPAGSAGSVGPVAGMGVARMVGTICYRSREEFDARFDHRPIRHVDAVIDDASTSPPPPPAATSPPHLFEVEQYLRHQAATFTGRYDANCYLTLSACMDLMDIGGTHVTHPSQAELASGAPSAVAWSYEHACSAVPAEKQILLLPIASDALIPPAELERLASVLGSQGKLVHLESIRSLYGHDAFLKESAAFNPRFAEFLHTDTNGVERVRRYVNSLVDL